MSQVQMLASKSVPFRPTTVQIPNLALFETKRITVYVGGPLPLTGYPLIHGL